MSNIVYIQVSIFPIAALLAVMDNLKRDMSFSWRRRCLESIMKLMVCIMICSVLVPERTGGELSQGHTVGRKHGILCIYAVYGISMVSVCV